MEQVRTVVGSINGTDALSGTIDSLYRDIPNRLLFHYASLKGMVDIVRDRHLWASEVRYLNDASEITHFTRILDAAASEREALQPEIVRQFRNWCHDRLLGGGPMVFVSCFTERGNLLSQWRGYCPWGSGASLGFNPAPLLATAQQHGFRIGPCIYERMRQRELADVVLDAVVTAALERGAAPPAIAHPSQSFHPIFYDLEPQILQVAALVKNSAFAEEAEWRAVSRHVENYKTSPIDYRPGATTLIPYVVLPLPTTDGRLTLEQVFVGPTPNMGLSVAATSRYLSRFASCKRVENCQIPYRER